MIIDVTTLATGPVETLCITAVHYLLEDTYIFTFLETIIMPHDASPEIVFRLDANLIGPEHSDRLGDDLARTIRDAIQTRADERGKYPSGVPVHLFQQSFPHPLQFSTEPLKLTRRQRFEMELSWWNIRVTAPLCDVQSTGLTVRPSILAVRQRSKQTWERGRVYALRFGFFSGPSRSFQTWLRRDRTQLAFRRYSLSLFGCSGRTRAALDPRSPGRVWLCCHPREGLMPIVTASRLASSDNKSFPDTALGGLTRPHSEFRVVAPINIKIRRFMSIANLRYEREGLLPVLPFVGEQFETSVALFRWLPGSRSNRRLTWLSNTAITFYAQDRPLHFMRHIEFLVMSLGGGALAAYLADDGRFALLGWLATLLFVEVANWFFDRSEATAYPRQR
jgi:hypothetical protein